MGLVRGKSGSKPLAAQQTILHSIRVQTSSLGTPLPVLLGQGRLPGKLLAYYDFLAIPHQSQANQGGKGGLFGGGKQSDQVTFTYQAAVLLAICVGQILGLRNVWDTKGNLSLVSNTETFVVPGGGTHTPTPPSSGVFYDDSGVGVSTAYSQGVNDYGSDGAITLAGNYPDPRKRVAGTPAAGQYKINPSTGQYTFHASDVGKTVTITYVYSIPNSNSDGNPLTQLALTLFTGAQGQAAWSYLSTNHPTEAIGYTGIAYVADPSMDLGSSGNIPNYSYEVAGLLQFGGGILDCNPADILNYVVTNPTYAAGLDSAFIVDWSQFNNYCVAQGIFLTLIMDQQQESRSYIDQILKLTNSEMVWSENQIKIFPYADTSVAGNGKVFVADTQPIYEFTDADYICAPDSDPVEMSSVDDTSAFNVTQLEILDRANSYNTAIIEDKDDAAILDFGQYTNSVITAHEVTTRDIGALVAYALNRRSAWIKRSFKFTVSIRYLRLDPMNIVLINDAKLGLSHFAVRIKKITENDNYEMQIEAEEFPFGVSGPVLYAKQSSSGFVVQSTADPGDVNSPIIFEANDRLTTTGQYEAWMGISGPSANWGGANIRISFDGVDYKKIGTVFGGARMGLLTSNLGANADPDTTHTVGVDLTQSFGELLSGSALDCDNFRTLFIIGNELMSYQVATLTSAFHYTLGTRLRRGVFGSPVQSHSIGDQFLRLDDSVFIYGFDPTEIGKTVHLKFTSFNTFGLMEQSEANVTDYTYVLGGNFNNSVQFVSNDATVDYVGTPGGGPFTAATVRAYGVGGPGGNITLTKGDKSTKTVTAVNVTGQALSTKFYVMCNPGDLSTYLLTSYNDMANAVFNGHICIGSTTTPAAGGGGGTTGGGGGSSGGGGGKGTL